MTRSVWRKRVKVIGLVLSVMMLALWVFSVIFVVYYTPPSRQWDILLLHGRISFGDGRVTKPGWFSTFSTEYYSRMMHRVHPAWLGFALPVKLSRGTYIPIWLLVVAVGFPTTILWWRDRRPKAGFCKVCKYDLTGNESGTCPECGTAVDASEHGAKPSRDGV